MRFFALVVSVMVIAFCAVFFYPSGSVQSPSEPVQPSSERAEAPSERVEAPSEHSQAQTEAPAHTLPLFPKPMVKTELMERKRVPNYVQILLFNSDFEKLEELADHYRSTKARTPSGLWYLSLFHQGVRAFIETVRSKPNSLPEGMTWEGSADEMHAKIFDNWRAAFPNSPNPYLAHAALLRQQAWRIRGHSYAHEVPQEQWRPFLEKLTAARDYLVKHEAIASKDPEWHTVRIYTATELSEPTDQIVETLNKATEMEPYYYTTYFAAARHFLPKWGGDPRYIPALTNMAAENTMEKDGNSLHARIYWFLGGNSNIAPRMFTIAAPSWAKMAAGMDDIARNYPDSWNINNFLYFSCQAGDRNQAQKMLDKMIGEPIMAIWKDAATLNQCKDFARGLDLAPQPGNPT